MNRRPCEQEGPNLYSLL